MNQQSIKWWKEKRELLLITRQFSGAVIFSYRYTGETLPTKALKQFFNSPLWVFDWANDIIFRHKTVIDLSNNQYCSITCEPFLKGAANTLPTSSTTGAF
jgi:hypothetical protein